MTRGNFKRYKLSTKNKLPKINSLLKIHNICELINAHWVTLGICIFHIINIGIIVIMALLC